MIMKVCFVACTTYSTFSRFNPYISYTPTKPAMRHLYFSHLYALFPSTGNAHMSETKVSLRHEVFFVTGELIFTRIS